MVPLRKYYARLLLAIAAAAFAVRFLAAWQLAHADGGWNPVFHPSRLTDLNTYMELARSVLNGSFSGPFYYQPFYYTVFLPLVYAVGGGSQWAVILAQALLGAASCWLAGRIAGQVYGRAAGLTAATLCAISAALIFYTPYCMIVTLQAFWMTLSAFLLLRLLLRRRVSDCVWLGLTLGAGILTRGNLWFVLGGVLLLLLLHARGRGEYRAMLVRPAVVLLTALLLQAPFIAWNSVQSGRLTGPSTASGAVLALGNSPESPPGFLEYPISYEVFMAREKSGEISVPMQIFAWAWREPGAFAELTFRKLLLFWDRFEIYNNVSIYYDGAKSPLLRVFMGVGSSALLLVLGAAGLLLFPARMFRKHSYALLGLYGFVIVYWASIAAFYILSRFRAPVLPLLAVFGALALCRTVRSIRRQRLNKVFGAELPALAFGVFLAFYANDLYRGFMEAAMMRLVRPEGVFVELTDGRTMRLDSGPRSCGNWQMAELRPGSQLSKVFAGMPATAVRTVVGICISSPRSGLLVLEANGGEKRILLEPGMKGYEFETEIGNGFLSIGVVSVEPGVGVVFDAQREYFRSGLDSRTLPGEWVMRAFY